MNKKTNTLSIISLIVSIFSVIIGTILCLIALSQIKSRNERGEAFAIAGIVINILKVVGVLIFGLLLILAPSTSTNEYKCLHAKNCTLNSDGNTYTCTLNNREVEEYITCTQEEIDGQKGKTNYGSSGENDSEYTFDFDNEME